MLKTRLTLYGIFLVILTFSSAMAYFKGRSDGTETCTAKYEAQIAQERNTALTAVTNRLTEIDENNKLLRSEYQELNRQISAGVFTKVVTVREVVEKAVEKPVFVQGDCRIDYDGVARVFDAVATAASDN
jgi:biopolymer transport protein ExbD